MGNFNLTPQQSENGLTVLELFCGGGLGAIGFKAAGYDIVKALDFDKNAVKAYRHNFGDHVEQADINEIEIDSLPDTDVIFGGPPCQDFSVAGKGAGTDGERGKLVWRYLEIIERKHPKSFVFENVKGLITKRHRPTFDALIEKFNEIGYEISWRVMSAWDYGVAQKRERVFIVGIRKDLGFTFEFPKPLEGDYQTRVLRDVIGDLPEPSGLTDQLNHAASLKLQTDSEIIPQLPEGISGRGAASIFPNIYWSKRLRILRDLLPDKENRKYTRKPTVVSPFVNAFESNLRQILTSCQTIFPYRRNIGSLGTELLRALRGISDGRLRIN